MRNIIALAVCLLLLLAGTAHAELKVAVFDLQHVANKSEALKSAQAKMTSTYDGKKKELEAKRQKLEKQAEAMNSNPTKAQQDEFRKMQKDYQEAAQLYVRNIQAAEINIRETMDNIIVEAARQLAQDKGYDLVLDSTAAVYSKDSMNVTNDMQTYVNKVWKANKK